MEARREKGEARSEKGEARREKREGRREKPAVSAPELRRETPYHPAHATAIAGLSAIQGGDNRFYNNLFVGAGAGPVEAPKKAEPHRRVAGYGTWVYDARERPSQAGGNVYLNGARPYAAETNASVAPKTNPEIGLVEERGSVFLMITVGSELKPAAARRVTTALLGKAAVSGLPFVNPDGSPLAIDADYFGAARDPAKPSAGPFGNPGAGAQKIKVW